jgi:hypothetical protein
MIAHGGWLGVWRWCKLMVSGRSGCDDARTQQQNSEKIKKHSVRAKNKADVALCFLH